VTCITNPSGFFSIFTPEKRARKDWETFRLLARFHLSRFRYLTFEPQIFLRFKNYNMTQIINEVIDIYILRVSNKSSCFFSSQPNFSFRSIANFVDIPYISLRKEGRNVLGYRRLDSARNIDIDCRVVSVLISRIATKCERKRKKHDRTGINGAFYRTYMKNLSYRKICHKLCRVINLF